MRGSREGRGCSRRGFDSLGFPGSGDIPGSRSGVLGGILSPSSLLEGKQGMGGCRSWICRFTFPEPCRLFEGIGGTKHPFPEGLSNAEKPRLDPGMCLDPDEPPTVNSPSRVSSPFLPAAHLLVYPGLATSCPPRFMGGGSRATSRLSRRLIDLDAFPLQHHRPEPRPASWQSASPYRVPYRTWLSVLEWDCGQSSSGCAGSIRGQGVWPDRPREEDSRFPCRAPPPRDR